MVIPVIIKKEKGRKGYRELLPKGFCSSTRALSAELFLCCSRWARVTMKKKKKKVKYKQSQYTSCITCFYLHTNYFSPVIIPNTPLYLGIFQ